MLDYMLAVKRAKLIFEIKQMPFMKMFILLL